MLLLLAALSVAHAALPTTVPFTLHDNRILVEARVNGAGPFTFIFDTGGSNILTPEAARRLGLRSARGKPISGAGERKQESSTARVASYSVGGLALVDQDFLILDLAPIRRAFRFEKLDGVIGFEILQRAVTTVDFQKLTLTFTPPENFTLPAEFTETLPFALENEKPVIDAWLDGKPARIVVDTGDRSAVTLFEKFAESRGMDRAFMNQPVVVSGYGVGGPIPARLGKLTSLRLGPALELRDVLTRLPTTRSGIFATSPLAASIGNEVLRRFSVVFDYSRKRLALRKSAAFGDPYRFSSPLSP